MMDNKANHKAIGDMLMKNERSSIGPVCVDLMLKDFEKIHVPH